MIKNGERVYPIKDADTIGEAQAAYQAKIEKNKKSGRLDFESGNYPGFKGYPVVRMDQIIGIMLQLDEESQRLIQERVVEPLSEIADKYNVPNLFAGREDLPSHVTLEAGIFQENGPEEQDAVEKWLRTGEAHLTRLSAILTGLKFSFDTLIVAPNSYICSSRVDDTQGAPFRARQIVRRIMHRVTPTDFFGPLYPRYDDIFHSSVSRVTEVVSPKMAMGFLNDSYETVGQNLQRSPLEVMTQNVYIGKSGDFLRQYAPGVLI